MRNDACSNHTDVRHVGQAHEDPRSPRRSPAGGDTTARRGTPAAKDGRAGLGTGGRGLATVALAGILVLAAPVRPQDDAAARVEDYLARCAAFGWSGAAVVARGDDVLVACGFGSADRGTGRAIDADTLFEIASATKPFTACAVMKLVEMGKVALDDPISRHLPAVPEDKGATTVRHLLAHTSGMPRRGPGGRGPDLAAAVADYLREPAVRLPGAAYEYWNGGYALLAGIVERASGQSFTTFCNEHLFRPAGLERTGFTGDALPREVQAVGYDGDTAVRLAAEHPYGSSYGWQYRGMGGIVTSASELHRFVRALESGLVLKPESVRLMQTRVSASYGLGWGVTETKRKTRRISHGGDVRGFHTQLLRFPDEDGVIILLSNVEGVPLWTLAWNLEAELFGGPHSYPVPPAAVPLPEPVLDRLCGTFALPNGGGRLVLEREGQAVRVCAEGSAACALLTGCEPPAGIGASVSATRLYVPVTATELATFDWMAPTRLPRLRLEPHDDAPSHLIAHTPGGRETRLTEER